MAKAPESADPLSASRPANAIVQLILLVGAIALLTGAVLWPSYIPDPNTAHQSVQTIQSSPFLGVIRGIHHWSSALLILLGGAYVILALAKAAYRHPHRKVWVGVLALTGLGLGLQLTGHLLPWDKQAVSTAVVETSIAEGAPVVGKAQANFLRGGDSVGPATLDLWSKAHFYVLPLLYVALGLFLLGRLRRYPQRWNKAGALAAAAILVGLGFAIAAPLGPGATAIDYDSFGARPEWYILPLHALLTLFQGFNPSLAFVGTMVVPGIAVLFLLALPWLDAKRGALAKPTAGAAALLLVGLILFSLKDMAPPVGAQTVGDPSGVSGKPLNLDPALVAQGKAIFVDRGCDDCHKVNGVGGKVGPDLTNEAQRHSDINWQILHLNSPSKATPGSTMPPFARLGPDKIKALANYVLSQK